MKFIEDKVVFIVIHFQPKHYVPICCLAVDGSLRYGVDLCDEGSPMFNYYRNNHFQLKRVIMIIYDNRHNTSLMNNIDDNYRPHDTKYAGPSELVNIDIQKDIDIILDYDTIYQIYTTFKSKYSDLMFSNKESIFKYIENYIEMYRV